VKYHLAIYLTSQYYPYNFIFDRNIGKNFGLNDLWYRNL